MFNEIFYFLFITNFQICFTTNLQWNTKKPFKYNGFIYTDSNVAIVDPVLQVLIDNGEEVCNFQINQSDFNRETLNFNPFRAVVKSARMGLGEIELLPNANLRNYSNVIFDLIIAAEACHNPDSWSDTAMISIKVIDPPGPLWTKSPYNAVINNDAIIGSFVIKVMAYLPRWADPDNKICQYRIERSENNPFTIDGSGVISTRENLLSTEIVYVALDVIAEDCSQPIHRQSKVNVFVTINPTCKFGWTGFYKLLNYKSGSAVASLWKKPLFQFCHKEFNNSYSRLIADCQSNQKLRVTVSVELKSVPHNNIQSNNNDVNICNLDYQSLKLQRKICDIDENKLLDLLTILSKQRIGVMEFPLQPNVFPELSLATDSKFSLYFWMRRKTPEQMSDEFIVCQLNETGDKLFHVSISHCNLKIFLHPYQSKKKKSFFQLNQEIIWEYNLQQTCDDKWHHYLILIYMEVENSQNPEVRIFVDAELVEFTTRSPNIKSNEINKFSSSHKFNLYIGQCSKNLKNKFKGYLAGLILLPNIILKSSNVRCLMKCMERLYFNGMNQMNPGMSVSLNSEMQTIIINGHNIEEVGKLVEVIGYANPKWDPIVGSRIITIQTDMSCNKRVFNIPFVEINVNVTKQRNGVTNHKLITSIKLSSDMTSIHITNDNQLRSDTGTGLGIFENTTINIFGLSQTTLDKYLEDTLTISRCIIVIHPELVEYQEYIEWPQQAIETFKTDHHSMEVRNNSKKIIFFGEYNQQIYEFIIQHIRYFSSLSSRSNRKFQLQCSTDVGMSIINSNMLVIKVFAKNASNYVSKKPTTKQFKEIIKANKNKEKYFWNKIDKNRNRLVEMRAQSDAAKLVETELHNDKNKIMSHDSNRINKVYNIFLGIGIFILIISSILMAKKLRKYQTREGCLLSFKVIDCICFPLQSIKEKLKPSSTVRVELSRDFIYRASGKRRDIGLEMQWDDAELKPDLKYHIIENPIYDKTDSEFDDNYMNNDIPPICDVEELSSDNDTDNETEVENSEKMSQIEESIMKKRLIDL